MSQARSAGRALARAIPSASPHQLPGLGLSVVMTQSFQVSAAVRRSERQTWTITATPLNRCRKVVIDMGTGAGGQVPDGTAACLPGGKRAHETHRGYLESDRVTGIDLGAKSIYCVSLSAAPWGARRQLIDVAAFTSEEIQSAVAYCAPALAVAVDAPPAPSTNPHGGDPDLGGWQTARCTEFAMRGRGGRWGPPWPTPLAGQLATSWMSVGFRLWSALRTDGHDGVFEVYPHALFECLARGIDGSATGRPSRIPNKATVAGQRMRRHLLSDYVELPPGAVMWGHDWLDALVSALLAYFTLHFGARPVVCDPPCLAPDDSGIWMPTRCGAGLRTWFNNLGV